MDRADVTRWIDAYEQSWRTAGTEHLAELFTPGATYLPSPWERRLEGLAAIAAFWESEREGPDEVFDLNYEVVATEGDTAVVRVAVDYHRDPPSRWRDLWIVRFAPDGRCSAFEEWPFAPDQRGGHED